MNPARKAVIAGAIAASTLAGGALGAVLINGSASAADNSTSTTAASGDSSTAAPAAAAAPDPTKGGHVANGITEQLLTGDTADKVKAAALAAVEGGTIQRVENDAEGATYEAHMTKADGTQVTVKLDADFKVTSVETGPTGPPAGQAPGSSGSSSSGTGT